MYMWVCGHTHAHAHAHKHTPVILLSVIIWNWLRSPSTSSYLNQYNFSNTGSTFPKAKPQSGIWLAGLHGISRIILLPFYASWWIRETSCTGFFVVLSVYSSILMSGIIMFCCRNDEVILKVSFISYVLMLLFFGGEGWRLVIWCANKEYSLNFFVKNSLSTAPEKWS